MGSAAAGASRPATRIAAALLLIATILLYVAVVANIATMNDSDPAGNGLSYAYGVFLTVGLWVLMGLLMIAAAAWGDMPGWARLPAVILVPASGAAALTAMTLMRAPGGSTWPILIPALAPLLVVAQALSAFVPALRMSRNAAAGIWSAVLVLALLPWPVTIARDRAATERRARIEAEYEAERVQRETTKREATREKFARLDANSPLWEWWDFTLPGSELRDQALAAMRTLPRRQVEAQSMLEGGFALPMSELPNLALEATPAFCLVARRFLRRHADSLRTGERDPIPYAVVAPRLETYLPGMRWLAANGCDCTDEFAAFEATARGYPDSPERRRFLATLDELRGRP